MFALISSLLVAASVGLFVFAGYPFAKDLLDARASKDAAVYEKWVDELFLGWTLEQAKQMAIWANLLVIGSFAIVLVLTFSFVFAGAVALGAFFVPKLLFSTARQRRLKRFEAQLPDAVDIMVASVRAGRSLAQAIGDVARKLSGPVGQEFGVIAGEYERGGVSIEEALSRTRDRLKLENFTMISSALIINSQRGGDLLLMLERISESIREVSRLQKKLVSEMSEVRAQEKMVLGLTPLFGGLICLFDPSIPQILFHTVLGNLLLVAVIGVQVIGIMWIRRIVRTAV